MKKRINKTVKLSFELTKYLMGHPSITSKIKQENFVVFQESDKSFNVHSENVLKTITKKGKSVVRATRRKGNKNTWKFQIVHP